MESSEELRACHSAGVEVTRSMNSLAENIQEGQKEAARHRLSDLIEAIGKSKVCGHKLDKPGQFKRRSWELMGIIEDGDWEEAMDHLAHMADDANIMTQGITEIGMDMLGEASMQS